MKIRIDKLDALYSVILRKERPVCECCRRRKSTQVHHFFSRRNNSVRFDDTNCWCLCFACHRKFHEDPVFAREMMLNRIGQEELDNLTIKKNMYHKIDYKIMEIYLKQRNRLCE